MHRTALRLLLGTAAPALVLASGQPDPSFGDGGVVTIHADYEQPFGYEFARDALVDHAGRYVTAGQAYDRSGDEDESVGLVTRTLAGGAPDQTLGGVGYVHLKWQGKELAFSHVQETTDGKLLLSNGNEGHITDFLPVVCRVEDSGQLDTTFGTAGCRTLEIVHAGPGLRSGSIAGMQLQPDGRILVLGRPVEDPNDPRGFALVRLLSDGSDDLSFGDPSGCPNPDPGCAIAFSPADIGDAISPGALALDPQQGRVVVAAHVNVDAFKILTAVRYKANGFLDLAFEPMNFGSLTGDPTTEHIAVDVQVTPDSSVFVAGGLLFDNQSRIAVAKFHSDGTDDSAFGETGRRLYVIDPQDQNRPTRLLLQTDGKLVIAGRTGDFFDSNCRLLRIDGATGEFDAAFGQDGIATSDALSETYCVPSSVVSDGAHMLLTGYSEVVFGDSNVFLLRLDRDGLFRDGFEP